MTERRVVHEVRRLHPAVANARELRRRNGLAPALTDAKILSRVGTLFERTYRSETHPGADGDSSSKSRAVPQVFATSRRHTVSGKRM